MSSLNRSFEIGDVTARYASMGSRVGLELFPTAMADRLATRRQSLRGLPEIDAIPDAPAPPAFVVDPLVHLKIVGDPYPGAFAQGRTMRNGPSIERFTFQKQDVAEEGGRT